MRGLILSGGKGSRLAPLTHTQAKQLVPVANKPILFYGIEAMMEAGIKEIGIIVSPETGADIESAIHNDADRFLGVRFELIEQGQPLGLAHALLTAKRFLGREDFCMYLGDNILQGGIKEPVREFERLRSGPAPAHFVKPEASLLLTRVQNPEEYGVAVLGEGETIKSLIEKPVMFISDLALVGVYLFSPAIIEAAERIEPSQRGELEITDAITELLRADADVRFSEVEGWWKDTGHEQDILQANRLVLEAIEPRDDGRVDDFSTVEGRVVIEAGARVEHSTVRGPAVIGPGALVQDSYVGPYTSIGASASLQDAEATHSILLERSSVSDHVLFDSLVGRDAYVSKDPVRPRGLRVFVGDKSRVRLP